MGKSFLRLLPAVLLLAGCDWEDLGPSNRFTEDFSYKFDLKPGGRVTLENFNGSVEILGWEKESVEIQGTKYAASKDLLDALKIEITPSDGSLYVRTVRPFERRSNLGARYRISVPRKTTLEKITSSNGSIRVEGVSGNGRLRTSNGAVRAMRYQGDLEATTSNGGVELTEFQGAATLTTSNGAITADGVRGHFQATTSNGTIDARLVELEAQRPVRVHTSNGNVKLTIESLRGNDVHADTSNGSITVRLPASTAARVRAHTSNSSVSTDFVVSGTQSKTRLEGAIGAGGPLLDLTSSNGSVRLLKL